MKRYGSIYIITNLIDGQQYVGQTTTSVKERYLAHCSESRNRYISNSIKKHGKENFKIEELFVCFDKDSLNELETYFVEYYNTFFPNGYNLRSGGNQNGKCSDELKRKISESKTGKPNLKRRGELRTQEQRFLISKGLGGRSILATEIKTGNKTIYLTAHETTKYGFQPWNVISVCKSRRPVHKGHKFEYLEENANQSGSLVNKNTAHAQRIEAENSITETTMLPRAIDKLIA